ncbi:hypothetical protein ABIF81_005408 [Bradyrhizobium daqingense]
MRTVAEITVAAAGCGTMYLASNASGVVDTNTA